jgi:7-cyano-7-deazaguanine synthase in queuosine biosynthesis
MVASQSDRLPTILCLFSGGIDSTGVLHRLMTDPQYVQHPLIVHHIHIFNRENRAKAVGNS